MPLSAKLGFVRAALKAVQLPGQVRSQVQLGNEGKNDILPCVYEVPVTRSLLPTYCCHYRVKKIALYPFFLVSVWLAGCHPDDLDGSKAASLAVLNRMEAVNIAHEKAGDPPPKGNGTWRAYWHSRFVTMQGVEDSGNFPHMGRDNIAFIKRQRAEAGLPPVD